MTMPDLTNKTCSCTKPAVKKTSDGYVCQRCLDFETDYYRTEFSGVRKRTDLKPKERDYSEAVCV